MSTTALPRLTPHQRDALAGLRPGYWSVERGVVYAHLVRKGYADVLVEKGPRGGTIRSYRKGTGATLLERGGQPIDRDSVPAAVKAHRSFAGKGTILVAQRFAPGTGWVTIAHEVVLTVGYVQAAQAHGITVLGLKAGDSSVADFTVAELLR